MSLFNLPPLEIVISSWKASEGARIAAEALGRVQNATKITRDELGRFQKRVVDTEPYVKNLKDQLLGLDKVIGAVGLAYAMKQAVQAAAAFEQQIATIQGVTGASAEEMSKLVTISRELGATSRYSSTQVAEALLTLVRAGQSVEQATTTITGVMNLAQGEMISLAEASDLVIASLAQFQVKAYESSRFVDVLVTSSNAANTSAVELGMALKFAGTFAATAGVSFEETSAALAVLSNNNLRGMLGGTSLRAIIALLVNDTDELEKSLSRLNLKYSDVDITTRGLVPVLKTLRDAGLDTKSALDIFGREAAPGALALTRQLGDLERIIGLNNDAAGAGKRLADVVSNTLSGALDRLGNSFSQVAISAGDSGALGVTKDLVVTFTDAVLITAGMDESIRGNATAAHLLANGFEAATIAAVTFVGTRIAVAVWDTVSAFRAATTAAQMFRIAMASTGLGLISIGVGAITAALIDFTPAANDAGDSMSRLNEKLEHTAVLTGIGANAVSTYKDALKRQDVNEQVAQLDLLLATIKDIESTQADFQGGSRLGPVVDVKQFEALFNFSEKSQRAYRELFRETQSIGGQVFTTINESAMKGNEKFMVYTSTLRDTVTTLLNDIKNERKKFTEENKKMKPEEVDTGAAKAVVDDFMAEMTREFQRDQNPLLAAADKAEKALRKTFKGDISPSDEQIKKVRDYAVVLYNLEQFGKDVKESNEARKRSLEDEAKATAEQSRRIKDLLNSEQDELALMREKDPIKRAQIAAEQQLNKLVGDKKPSNYAEILSQLKATVAAQAQLKADTEGEVKARERLEKLNDVKAGLDQLKTEVSIIEQYGDAEDALSEARERAAQIVQFQSRVEEAYKDDILGASIAVQQFAEAYDLLMTKRKQAEGRRERSDALRDVAAEYAALSKSNVEREHAADITKVQLAAEKEFGKGTEAAIGATENYITKLKQLDDAKRLASLFDDVGDAAGKAFTDAVFQANSLNDVVESLIRNLAKMAFEQLAAQQLSGFISGALRSFIPTTPSALGNVFSNGMRVNAYANGDVFSNTMAFNMRGGQVGMLGEAGSEAVMPLTRTRHGELGVKAIGSSGGSRPIIMNFNGFNADTFIKAAPHLRRELRRITR